MGKKARLRHDLAVAIVSLGAAALFAGWLYFTWEKIPASIRIKAGVEQELSLGVPVLGEIYRENEEIQEDAVPALLMGASDVKDGERLHLNLNHPVTVLANEMQNYRMDVKLFGIIPFKTVNVQVIPDEKLIPAGVPIGIYVRTDGLLVIAEGEFEGMDKTQKEPSRRLLQAGDYILKVNGEEVTTKNAFMEMVSNSSGEEMVLTIRRNEEVFEVKIKPEMNDEGEYKLGIWIRDNAQGVGTMTYLQEDYSFGALGHGINDTDTAVLMDVRSGSLYRTEIVSVKKGEGGTPGELTGIIDYNLKNKIGVIDKNSIEGIFGTVSESVAASIQAEPMAIGLKQEVRLGEAQILCCVDGETQPCLYTVEITGVHLDHDNVNRGLELKVTDPLLLERTGGIVQGMSGSPILQDGKIIGAVTHVLVNDPAKGYGIFIENMLTQ